MERIARVKIASFQTIPCSRLDYVTLKRFLQAKGNSRKSLSVFNAPFLDTDFSDSVDSKLAEPLILKSWRFLSEDVDNLVDIEVNPLFGHFSSIHYLAAHE